MTAPLYICIFLLHSKTKPTLSLNIQIVISRSVYLESFYEVAGYYINSSSVLFFEQKMIKIPDSLQNPTFAEWLNALQSRLLICSLWIHATQDGGAEFWWAAGSARVCASWGWKPFGKLKDKRNHLNVVLLLRMLVNWFGKHGKCLWSRVVLTHVPKVVSQPQNVLDLYAWTRAGGIDFPVKCDWLAVSWFSLLFNRVNTDRSRFSINWKKEKLDDLSH